MPSGHYYVKKLPECHGSLKTDLRKIEKLSRDKVTLKRHIEATRHNNGVLKKMVEDLKTKNEKIKAQLQETKAEVVNGNNEIIILKKKNEDLKKKNEDLKVNVEELEDEGNTQMTKHLQCKSEKVECDSENVSYLEKILELKRKQSKSTSDLHHCEEELEDELQKNKNLLCT